MNCAAPPSSGPGGGDLISRFLNEPQPGPSWMGPPSQQPGRPTDSSTAGSKGDHRSKKGHSSKPGPQTEVSSSATAALSITSLAVERHASEASMDRSMRPVMTNQTSVQASKSSAKIILDDHQMGYLAVVPPDIEKDLMKYTVPARDGVIGPRPIKPSMLFDFDYRQKISNLLPHESHKEISAHLHIAWKSIGQDIHQLYKDLAKRVEQKLKALNGETEGVRAVQKRKGGGGGGRRTSREPPPNSGLRRCNCSPDCPKYKIIPGSDLEKRWLAKYSRGERQKTVVLESFEGSSDGGVDPSPAAVATPPSASGPRLFGAPRTPVVTPTPQRKEGGSASDALSDPFPPQQPQASPDGFAQLPQHLLQPSAGSSDLHPDLLSSGDAGLGLRPEGSSSSSTTPLDIAQAAATAANLVQEPQYLQADPNVYYSMPQYVFNPMQPTFPPFVDPTNLQQMDQFQGSYICPDGTIVNAQGEPIAMTLPLSQFANLAGPSEAGSVNNVDNAVANPESSAVHQFDETAVVDAAPPTGDGDDDDMAGGEASALRAMATAAVVEGEVAQMGVIDGGHVAEIQIGIDRQEIPSDVVSPARAAVVEGSEADAGPFLGAAGRNVENESAPPPSGAASPESPIVRAGCDQPAGRDNDDGEGVPETTFTWHQVQAAEGREVPAQDIGWTWKRNVPTASSTSLLSDRKDEKEKSFALQANLNGVETESKEFKELKMTEGNEDRIPPPLDPRQTLDLEVEKKAETKSDGGGEREGDWEEEEEEREEEAEDREKGEEEKADEGEVEEEREIESGEETNAVEEERVIEQEDQVSAMECLPQVGVSVNVGILDVSGVAAIASTSADLMDFLEQDRTVE